MWVAKAGEETKKEGGVADDNREDGRGEYKRLLTLVQHAYKTVDVLERVNKPAGPHPPTTPTLPLQLIFFARTLVYFAFRKLPFLDTDYFELPQ